MLSKFLIRILKKFGFLEKINISGIININDRRFRIPVIKKIGYPNLFLNENWMTTLLKCLPVTKGVFIDVGSNIGQTLLQVRSVYRKLPYIGIEPNPACIFYLQELIKQNKLEQVLLFPCGIATYDGIGDLYFYEQEKTDSTASVIPDFRPGELIFGKEKISLYQFDNLLQNLKIEAIWLIKIDVEGAELDVLTSIINYVKKFRPQILLEILPVYSKESNPDRYDRQLEIEAYLSEIDYRLFRILKEDNKFQGLQTIKRIGIHGDINLCDYLASPVEQSEDIKKLKSS